MHNMRYVPSPSHCHYWNIAQWWVRWSYKPVIRVRFPVFRLIMTPSTNWTRSLVSQTGNVRFEPHRCHFYNASSSSGKDTALSRRRRRVQISQRWLAGWSSSEARWVHNPKVEGSNPSPATRRPAQGILISHGY